MCNYKADRILVCVHWQTCNSSENLVSCAHHLIIGRGIISGLDFVGLGEISRARKVIKFAKIVVSKSLQNRKNYFDRISFLSFNRQTEYSVVQD